jgi:hypothetical protein
MLNTSQGMKPTYFLNETDPKRYVDGVLEKIGIWREYASARGLNDLWSRKLGAYYGLSEDSYSSMRVISSGTEGELSNIKINDMRALVQNQLVVVTSARPTGIAKAINSDPKSIKNSRIATALAEYYQTEQGYEQKFVDACEIALIVDEAFLDIYWDKDAGDPVRPDADPEGQVVDGKEIMSGDAKLRISVPWNVARDPNLKSDDQKWHILSILMNRYDLAAANPDFSEQILRAAQDNVPQLKLQEREGEDVVYLHLVIADRTPAVPNGRYSMIVGDTLIADMKLPYALYPVEKITPAEVIDGPGGYCQSNDILAMEQSTDALHSIILSNNVTFGGQSLVGPPLTGVNIQEVAKGMRYFQVAPENVDKLKALQLTKSAPETFSYIDKLENKKQQTLGSVTGTLQAQAMQGASGSAMALIQSQAVQFNSGTQRAYFRAMSRVMTKLIGVLRVYADSPRIIRIVGKAKSQGLKEFKFTGTDLDSVSSITYEQVNPVSQTIGGRMDMAKDLISNGMITNPRLYLTFVQTGDLDVLTEPDEEMNLLILEENEALANAQPVSVLITENHQNHIKAHQSVVASPEAKADPELVQAVLAHIQDHLNVWQDASMNNPAILLATGQQPLPPPPAPPMPPGGPQGPVPPNGGPPPMPNPGEASTPPTDGGPDMPNMPRMPVNPATGERAQVPGAPQF